MNTEPLVTFGRAIELAERGFQKWAEKDHNRKWVRRIDGTPIPNDLKVNIALAIMDGLRETLPDERQQRIYRLERRIHNQRRQLRDTWETVEMRAHGWMGSPEGRRRFHDLLKRHRKQSRELYELRKNRPPLWRRIFFSAKATGTSPDLKVSQQPTVSSET